MKELVSLGDLVEIKGGGTPSRAIPEYWDGDIPWATVKDFKSTIIEDTLEHISFKGVESSATNIIPAGAIIVPTRMAVGKAAINKIDLAINQDLKALLPSRAVHSGYLLHFLLSQAEYLEGRAQGATVKGIKLELLRSLQFPRISLTEQRRVATILDKADTVRRKREGSQKLAEMFLNSTYLESFGASNWRTKPLSDVVKQGTIVTYGIVQAGPEQPGGVPYIRTGDIKNGAITTEGLRHTASEIASKFARSRVESGEIVMSIRATVGTTAFVPDSLHGANLTQGTARIAPGSETTREYLISFLRSTACQRWIGEQVKGATFREITLTRLRELEVPLPPMELQEAYSEIYRRTANVMSRLYRSRLEAEALIGSLSQRAFGGRS